MGNLRLKTAKTLIKKSFDIIDFKGKWRDSFGIPESSGIWMIWGKSGNGKTSFALQLSAYLCQWFGVWYVTLEEGERQSFKESIESSNLINHSNFKYSDTSTIDPEELLDEIKQVLRKKRSPRVVLIDSLQFLGLGKREYIKFKNEFGKKKIIIFISHAKGSEPDGRVAEFIRYDADVKSYVNGYKVFTAHRFGGAAEDFIIWEKGAYHYWNDIKNKKNGKQKDNQTS